MLMFTNKGFCQNRKNSNKLKDLFRDDFMASIFCQKMQLLHHNIILKKTYVSNMINCQSQEDDFR